MVLQDGHALTTHREVGVKTFQGLSVKVSVSSFSDLAVECCPAVLAEEVTLLTNRLRKPVAEERENHPHIDVVGIAHATRIGQRLALYHTRIVTKYADLDGLLHNIEVVVLALTDFKHLRIERITVCLRQPIPLTDKVDHRFFEDGR